MAASYGTVERSGRHHERKDIELQENGHYPLEKPRKPLTLTQSVIEWFKVCETRSETDLYAPALPSQVLSCFANNHPWCIVT
eukprot:32983-Amorphochlora_amoeboformis.AAC.1